MSLDMPPPTPLNPPAAPGGAPAGLPASGGASDRGGMQAANDLGLQIDQAITALSEAFPAGAEEFRQAKQLVLSGLAKAMAGMSVTSASPTAVGGQFPGATPSAPPPTGMPPMR